MIRTCLLILVVPAALAAQSGSELFPGFHDPFKVTAKGEPIAVTTGHAAPTYVDLNGDGLKDLVVGQFAEGKARIYDNLGKKGAPLFGEFRWLEAGGRPASVSPS